jgi:hypothetical protein
MAAARRWGVVGVRAIKTSEEPLEKKDDAAVCSGEKNVKLLHWIPPSAYLQSKSL